MQIQDMVSAQDFCTYHNVEISFIYSLQEYGLLEITTLEEKAYVSLNNLQQLEKMVLLYNEMDINLEGIDTITHLLQRINDMQQQITSLTNRLSVYENL